MSHGRSFPVLSFALVAAMCIGVAAALAQPQQPGSPPERVVSPDIALKIALDQLRAEADEFRRTGALKRDTISFSASFQYPIDPRDALEIVINRFDRSDPVVDAYVRWQMIGFAPDLILLDRDDRLRLGRELPDLISNPLLETGRHRIIDRLAQRAGGNARDRDELRQTWETWRIEEEAARLLNEPSFEFREFVIEAAPDDGPDRLILRVHDLEDIIEAGWETRTAKSRLTRELKERKIDSSISLEDRWKLIKLIESMESTESKVIRDVTIFAGDTPADVSYSTLAIRGSDVAKWSAYLNRRDP